MTQKVFFRMAPPQILSSVMSVLCLLIDSIVIGRLLGVDAMSAYGLSSPLLIIFTAATLILACGVQVLSAKAVGRSDTEQARECFSTSVAFALLLAALTILAVFCAGDPICVLLGADVDAGVFALTKQYLRGYFLGAPFFLLGQLATPYLQVMGRRREIMGSVVVMTASDIIFDFLSVYVWDAGMFGIGLGSGLSYLLSLAVVAGFFAKRECIFRFSPKDVRRRMLVELLSTGSPVALVEVCCVLRVYLMNRILLSLSGAGAVAAYSVIAVPTDILYHIGLGCAEVTLMLASLYYNEEDRAALSGLVRTAVLYTLLLLAAAVFAVELAAPWIVVLFLGRASAVHEIATAGLRLFAPALIPTCVNCVLEKYYLGVRRKDVSLLLAVCAGAVFTVPGAWLGGMLRGLNGVWPGVLAGQLATTLLLSILVWRKAGRVTLSPRAYSCLDDSFGAETENVLDCAARDADSAVEASRSLHDFCLRHGVRAKEAYMIALCAEEIAINIVRHGFAADRRTHLLELRAIRRNGEFILRFRDDCAHFDPTRYIELHRGDSPIDHIGLRMVMTLVSDAVYINSLGLNTLTLEIPI